MGRSAIIPRLMWWTLRQRITPPVAAGHHVVAPNMRGYTTSDAAQEVAACRLNTLAEDVIALAGAVGAGRFALAAHDRAR